MRVGFRLISEEEAGIPRAERGRYLPCRVIPDFPRPPVSAYPAGYLIVGVNRSPAQNRREILNALIAWEPGQILYLAVRRNPYLIGEPEWYEVEVPARLPE